jgi:hypothetical protein
MEKILVLMDPINPGNNALNFACFLQRKTPSRVTCILLDNPETARPVHRDLHGFPVVFADPDFRKNQIAAEASVEAHISNLKKEFAETGVDFERHYIHPLHEEDIIRESLFADLLILDARMMSGHASEESPTLFVREILAKSACPVIVAPENIEEPEEIVFCNNYTPDSIFAIKQFAHLFPQWQGKKLTILQIMVNNEKEKGAQIRLSEWLQNHFPDFRFEIFYGDVNHILFDYLFKRKNSFIVMGAYGRSALSTFLKKSTAGHLIKMISQPVFISHR